MDVRDSTDIGRLVEAAAATVAKAGSCWIASAGRTGVPRLRPMGRLPPKAGDDAWTFRFLTDSRSGKAANIRRAGKVALVFQREAEDSFVSVTGAARLEEREAEVRRLWKRAYDAYFPTEADKAAAIFLTVEAERLDLWIRGVTPEPFGWKTVTLERVAGGGWRMGTDGP